HKHRQLEQEAAIRQRAEAKLRASEQRFKTLAGSAPVGIIESDAEGNCLFVNDRWCHMAGRTPDQARGEGGGAALHPADRARTLGDWYAAAGEGRDFTAEYRFRTPHGQVTWLSGSAVALRDENSKVSGYIGTVTDITERKRAEEQLRRRAEEVETLMEVMPVAV